jgi:PAS domain S-box-containing protein
MFLAKPIDKSSFKILVVDDTIDSLRLIANMLTDQGYNVRKVLNGQMALTAAQSAPPDLILLDINMPQINGYEVCQQLKANSLTVDIPVIFISALDEVLDKVKAFAVGGIDYITKPFQFEEVIARVETQLTIRFLQQQLKEKTQKAIQAEDKYNRFFQYSNIGIFQISSEGVYQSINFYLAQLYGYDSPEQMMTQLISPENNLYVQSNRWDEILKLLETQEKITNLESQIYRADGSILTVIESIWLAKNLPNHSLYYEGIVIPIHKN